MSENSQDRSDQPDDFIACSEGVRYFYESNKNIS